MKKQDIIDVMNNIIKQYNMIAKLRGENKLLLDNESFNKRLLDDEKACIEDTMREYYMQMCGYMCSLSEILTLLNGKVRIEYRPVIEREYSTTFSWYATKYNGTLEYEKIVLVDCKTNKEI